MSQYWEQQRERSSTVLLYGMAWATLLLSILLDREQGKKMIGLLERLNPQLATQLIDASLRGPALVLTLKDALQAGRMVCIMADRARADERALQVQFMGGAVRLPEGNWSIATALGVPVILGFGLCRGQPLRCVIRIVRPALCTAA